jgi:hypothetical protein
MQTRTVVTLGVVAVVAALALKLGGCGNGSGTPTPTDSTVTVGPSLGPTMGKTPVPSVTATRENDGWTSPDEATPASGTPLATKTPEPELRWSDLEEGLWVHWADKEKVSLVLVEEANGRTYQQVGAEMLARARGWFLGAVKDAIANPMNEIEERWIDGNKISLAKLAIMYGSLAEEPPGILNEWTVRAGVWEVSPESEGPDQPAHGKAVLRLSVNTLLELVSSRGLEQYRRFIYDEKERPQFVIAEGPDQGKPLPGKWEDNATLLMADLMKHFSDWSRDVVKGAKQLPKKPLK